MYVCTIKYKTGKDVNENPQPDFIRLGDEMPASQQS